MHARQTGEGQFVDVAMVDALSLSTRRWSTSYSYTGMVTAPSGNSHPQLTPFDIYPTPTAPAPSPRPPRTTGNGCAGSCSAMDLLTDERTLTDRERVANAEFVRAQMVAWTSAPRPPRSWPASAGRYRSDR